MSLTGEQLSTLIRSALNGNAYHILPAVLLIDSPVTQDGTDMQVANLPGRQVRCDHAFATLSPALRKAAADGAFIFAYLN